MIDISKRPFKKIDLPFPISEDLSHAIDVFLEYINTQDGMLEDCYRDEIEFWLKDSAEKLSADQYNLIKDYYVFEGIYKKDKSNG